MQSRHHPILALALAGVLFGLTVPLTKVALSWLGPASITAVRFALAAPVLAYVGRARLATAWSRGVLASGALGYGGMLLLQNAGVERTSVGHAALLVGAVPAVVALLAALAGHGATRAVGWIGFGVALAGVGLVAGSGSGASLAGDVLVILSTLLNAAFVVVQARLLTGRDPTAVTAVQMAAAAAVALPGAAVEGLPALPSPAAAASVVALVLLGTLLPFVLFAYGQARVRPQIAGAFVNLEPVVGTAFAVIGFGNRFGASQIVGALAIVGGIALSSTSRTFARSE
jgi:drug/metabolite transporter (DMT)-like permease